MTQVDAYLLRRIYPAVLPARAAEFAPLIDNACFEFAIIGAPRLAAFLATIGHESGQLRYVRELASGAAYEGRRDLGNTEPGAGRRYRGRGLIQITGRANMAACGLALDLPLIERPELLEVPVNATRSAAWFWATHGLNEVADSGDFDAVSDIVNRGRRTRKVGDSIGWAERLMLYERARSILG